MMPDRPDGERQVGAQEERGEITAPVVIVAVALLVVVGVVGFWLDCYYRASYRFGAGVPASGPFALLVLLALAAQATTLRRSLRRVGLSR